VRSGDDEERADDDVAQPTRSAPAFGTTANRSARKRPTGRSSGRRAGGGDEARRAEELPDEALERAPEREEEDEAEDHRVGVVSARTGGIDGL
jgi:hypothetical protein